MAGLDPAIDAVTSTLGKSIDLVPYTAETVKPTVVDENRNGWPGQARP
jgi:hypothetical protein